MKTTSKILILVLLAVLAACVPSVQQVSDAASTLQAQITYVPVTWTPDVNTIVAQTFAAMTAQTGEQVAPLGTPTPSASAPGSISGNLSYPSSFIPPLRVVAFNLFDQSYRYVDTQQNQGTYQITGLAPGKYHVVAYTVGNDGSSGGLAGGYSQMVPCGLSVTCTDHSLIDVVVLAGADTPNINPGDWYAPADAFPPMPTQGISSPTAASSGGMDNIPPTGTISGALSYPADRMPPVRIVAFAVSDMSFVASMDTALDQTTYRFELPAGTYYILAYLLPSPGFPSSYVAAYTKAVVCGLGDSCTDHTLVPVTVTEGVTLSNVDPTDWSFDPSIYPPMPTP